MKNSPSHIERFHIRLLSFGSGLMVGTFFLEILPQLAVGETYLSEFIYLPFLGGFILIHILERLVYQHAAGAREKKAETMSLQRSDFSRTES